MKHLDVIHTPLEGYNLIEASAGTGKTYTLSLFAVRFIVELGYSIDEFLVVTYTRAATAELKERISAFIGLAAEYLQKGCCDNQEIMQIVDAARTTHGEDTVQHRIESALLRSDESQIFTIHSFCGRILSEFAFETSRSFDLKTVDDQSSLIREVVEDFWRSFVSQLSPFFISLLESSFSLAQAERLANRLTNYPLLSIHITELAENELLESWEHIKEEWGIYGKEIEELLSKAPGLKRAEDEYRIDRLIQYCEALTKGFNNDLYPGVLGFFSAERLQKGTKAKKETPEHPFFRAVSSFLLLQERFSTSCKKEFVRYVRKQLQHKKEYLSIQSQDDLITAVYASVISESADPLISAVQGRYKAAMVDEFQDTDRIQFEIFDRLFKGSTLFMIGDPKQAIYRFRGGDIEAYLHAAEQVTHRYTLKINYRSEPGLIAAFNELFSVENPFLYTSIEYEEKLSGASSKPLQESAKSIVPMTIWHNVPKKQLCWDSFAEEIVRLLERGVHFDDEKNRPLVLSDMAVLVHSNKEAQEVKEALTRRGVQAVVSKSGSIFASYECEKIFLTLKLLLEPARESLSRTLLVSKFFGKSHEDIEAMVESDTKWNEWLTSLYKAREILFSRGVSQALDSFLRDHKIYANLLDGLNGERAVTNMRHLMEILHQQELLYGHEPERLIQFLSERMQDDEKRDEHELRLESEGDAVTIMTVHKSKGLQFPIVFYALTPRGRGGSKDDPIYATPEGMVMDLRSEKRDEVQSRCDFEESAEALRLFYVAVTRAEYKLYLAMIKPPKAGYDPHTPMAKYLTRNFAHPHIEVTTAPDCKNNRLKKGTDDKGGPVNPFPRNRKIELLQQVRSYTALTKGTTSHHSVELPEVLEGIFAFPRGPRAGTALHEIFEELDFTSGGDEPHVRATVEKVMARYSYEKEELQPVVSMVQQVINKDLGGFTLSQLLRHDRVTEMEFFLKADTIDEVYLKEILGDRVGHISKGSVDSFLNGFIDLLFRVNDAYFILDWKSNFLGGTVDAYGGDALAEAMLEHNYHLQYLLYTVAVVMFLEKRMENFSYDTHFGGVYYIFLRGVEDGESMNGIYFRKPKEQVIRALIQHFSGQGEKK